MTQNNIKKTPINSLGYGFIDKQFIPKGKNEYYLRNFQNRSGINYRKLSAYEIEVLVRNSNTSDNWNNILVSASFNPELVKNCKFHGLIRIGKLETFCLSFSDLKVPVGLYNSTIISCDLGDNVAIENVSLLSHYILGNEVIIQNVNELLTTNHVKFGNGIIKKGEDESVRIWMEICNENGGRKVMPFNGMLPGDAYLWSKYREDNLLMKRFQQFTEKNFDNKRGYYGKIGDRTVIKNSGIIKDVWIGTDAYIKGANKLKNLTINSGEKGLTQIGEGCELVNGIIGYGCKLFYGVKAVRFIMASHSQLKYGARLINSYLGNNATVSCCEVLNSMIFPAHEQHHNNSFLCAALVMGQSNIAAGATIGSNHNSRGAEGEIIMGRGFWPGLCVSLKHNSSFASFTILAKGDYPNELNIPMPFSLISMDESKDVLQIMPGYWFLYNMYALTRNSWKYVDRDKRTEKIQHIEYDYLAPDTINELFNGLEQLEYFTGKAYFKKLKPNANLSRQQLINKGKELLLSKDPVVNKLEIVAEGYENSQRKTVVLKTQQAYNSFIRMIKFYGATHLINLLNKREATDLVKSIKNTPIPKKRAEWKNVGGQLLPEKSVKELINSIKQQQINSWQEVHQYYISQGEIYSQQKTKHALTSLLEIYQLKQSSLNKKSMAVILKEVAETKKWIGESIFNSKKKDYTNPYRKMIYSSKKEMDEVLGKLEDNTFINQQKAEVKEYTKRISNLLSRLK